MIRTRPFLQSITYRHVLVDDRHVPVEPVAAGYTPRDTALRAAHHQPGTCSPGTWPVRLTRCGEDPGPWLSVEHLAVEQLIEQAERAGADL